jgi:SAM-dependent methyltransferase
VTDNQFPGTCYKLKDLIFILGIQQLPMNIYDSEEKINTTFDPAFIPEEQLQAQWSELIQIKKVIHKLYASQKKKLSILDIGVGTGRIIRHLSGIPEIWNCVESYTGIDNNPNCLSIAQQNISEWQLNEKVSLIPCEAKDISKLDKKFDLIMTTWFTPGNFYPSGFDFATYDPVKRRLSLSKNPAFTSLFTGARNMLKKNGIVILGSCYHQNDRTRLKQEDFYKKCGMKVITDEKDTFTATREGFWSQRFSSDLIKKYLKKAGYRKIRTIKLDEYDFAFQVHLLN